MRGLEPSIIRKYGHGESAINRLHAEVTKLLEPEVVTHNQELFGMSGPMWNREFAYDDEDEICTRVSETLEIVGAHRMVIGHTPQTNGVSTRCETEQGPLVIMAD